MKADITLVFDFLGTLVQMRPPKLLIQRALLAKIAQNFRIGIVTGGRRTEVNNVLSKLKIRKYFNFIVTKDDSPYRKPDKRLLGQVIKTPSERIIYIGDSQKDFSLAQNAKIAFCYVGKRKYGIFQSENINQIIGFIVKNFLK